MQQSRVVAGRALARGGEKGPSYPIVQIKHVLVSKLGECLTGRKLQGGLIEVTCNDAGHRVLCYLSKRQRQEMLISLGSIQVGQRPPVNRDDPNLQCT